MMETSFTRSESFLNDQSGLNSVINKCSTLQTSISSFKLLAACKLARNKLKFGKLKRESDEGSMKRWINSQTYKDGKAVIASKAKLKKGGTENKQLDLVKSLVVIHGAKKADSLEASHGYACIKDLSSKQVSQLLLLNRRKFGESFLTSLQSTTTQPHKVKLSFDFDEQPWKSQTAELYRKSQKRSLSQMNEKAMHKNRQLLTDEQEKLYEKMEKMNPLNKLVIKNILKYKPILRSKLHYAKGKSLERINSQVVTDLKPLTDMKPFKRSISLNKVRLPDLNTSLPMMQTFST
mmetsp:Transcript_6714/g.11944  ORF Transcript_6714/g.11944 Transcript_6714/m.11944 type:complete len:292 (-) Transcript_6714:3679-4554(-)